MVKFARADDALRAALIRRFAEIKDDGHPLRCTCVENKIVFAGEREATGFATAANELDDGKRRVYACPRIPGVWHFTRQDAKPEPLEAPDAS